MERCRNNTPSSSTRRQYLNSPHPPPLPAPPPPYSSHHLLHHPHLHRPRHHNDLSSSDRQKRRSFYYSDGNISTSRRGGALGPANRAAAAGSRDFSELPYDVLARIAAPFDLPELWAASMVCRAWREALRPLREAMVLLRWGKRFKHGHDGGGNGGEGRIRVRRNPEKALESFLKGAARGSAPAMVDAGLMYWEMGRKEEGKELYRRAAELGHPTAQCNLGISYLEANPSDPQEAVKWFYRAAMSGYARAQYSLALCLHRGHGVKCDISNVAKWYLRAAEGGNIRAMYNTSICFSLGEGLKQCHRQARIWMKRAADYGHSKAQFEHGLKLFSSGDLMKALVYLELAVRAGETSASHIKNEIMETLSQKSRDRAMLSADRWRPSSFHR